MPARRNEGRNEMPAYYDEKTKTWYCKFYYTDYTGSKKQKKKRGFKLQREAKSWERDFLERQQGQPDMLFSNMAELYLEDAKPRVKGSTYNIKSNVIKKHLIPYFGGMQLNSITPLTIRQWQTYMMDRDEFSSGFLINVHRHLSSIFNFAMKYYGLQKNPCNLAGNFKDTDRKKMNFWTLEQYQKFIKCVDNPTDHVIFQTLYYTGMRKGELIALTRKDIDLEVPVIHITKTFYRGNITSPKTPKSVRDILIPDILKNELESHMSHIYGLSGNDRIFMLSESYINEHLNKYALLAEVPIIRVHDLRHSHVALLVEMGFNPMLIAERLGHEDVSVTMNRYAHLYPNKQVEIINGLNNLVPN